MRWEAVALSLAHKAGIPVPHARVELLADKPVLLLRRFDRDGARRIPFLSAMSMLGGERQPGPQLPGTGGCAAATRGRAAGGHARALSSTNLLYGNQAS